jgi:hypothetical protein
MSNDDPRDYDLAVAALRGEEHPAVDKERVRQRLLARGVALGAALGAGAVHTAKASSPAWLASSIKLLSVTLLVAGLSVLALRNDASTARPRLQLSEQGPERARSTELLSRFSLYPPAAPAPPGQASAGQKHSSPDKRASSAMDGLARENTLLSGAAAALRAGDTSGAARLLDQHEREFPAGFLRTEREKARARLAASAAARSSGDAR